MNQLAHTMPLKLSEIVGVIEEWVTSTKPGQATLQLWPFVMDLDSHCPASIISLESPYPILSTGGSQIQLSSVKEQIDTCLSSADQFKSQ